MLPVDPSTLQSSCSSSSPPSPLFLCLHLHLHLLSMDASSTHSSSSSSHKLLALAIFQALGKSEYIRSIHVHKQDSSAISTQQEFRLSAEGAFSPINEPLPCACLSNFSPSGLQDFMAKLKKMHEDDGWQSILQFRIDSPAETSIIPLLSVSRNPALEMIPAFAHDLRLVERAVALKTEPDDAPPSPLILVAPLHDGPAPNKTAQSLQLDIWHEWGSDLELASPRMPHSFDISSWKTKVLEPETLPYSDMVPDFNLEMSSLRSCTMCSGIQQYEDQNLFLEECQGCYNQNLGKDQGGLGEGSGNCMYSDDSVSTGGESLKAGEGLSLLCLPLHESVRLRSPSLSDAAYMGDERGRRRGQSSYQRGSSEKMTEITLSQLSRYFNMPITQASKELKVGLTVLKKRCREFGIPRWPHRKMKSLDSLIHNIQELVNEPSKVIHAVKQLEEQKKRMEMMPGTELAEKTKKLRQACFKASYRKRRQMAQSTSLPQLRNEEERGMSLPLFSYHHHYHQVFP